MSMAFVTVAVPMPRSAAADARTQVRRLGKPASDRIDEIGTIHFMSLTVVDEEGQPSAHLLMTLTADGGADAALTETVRKLEPELRVILQSAKVPPPGDLAGFLRRHSFVFDTSLAGGLRPGRTVGLAFNGLPAMTVARVRQEKELADRIAQLPRKPGPALDALNSIRTNIYADGGKRWAFEALDAPFLGPSRSPGRATVARMLAAGLLPLAWPLLLIPAAALLWGSPFGWPHRLDFAVLATIASWGLLALLAWRKLRRAEAADVPDDAAPAPAKVAEILERENRGPLNLLITVSPLKPGWFRRLTLRLAFRAIEQYVLHGGRPGFLGGNGEIGTLHSGRWLLLPNTDLLMFVAHYDGSWLSYLQDFVDEMTLAPTAIWSNTAGFPRTKNLFQDGVADGDRATRWFHRQQRPVDFWHAAFPDLTLGRIRTNAAIRRGFATAQTEGEAQEWLALLGAPRPAARPGLPQEHSDVQTLAYGALTHRPFAALLALRLTGDVEASRAWLGAVAGRVSYGRARRRPRHDEAELPADLVLGIAAPGLLKLGMSAADLDTFPAPFVNGMDAPGRARLLGDEPCEWKWGHREQETADVALLVYACSDAALEAAIEAASAGAEVVRRVDCQKREKHGMVEPFGFRDGLSQPVMPGTPAFERGPPPDQVVGPGEFVLGFPDDDGRLPPVPSVASDPDGLLPRLPDGRADIGSGSSFLVIRQLQQFVDRFEDAARDLARAAGLSEKAAAAKIVGRWQNGSSLVRNPSEEGPAPDNDFRFALEDPDGLACPLGAHIRRANPRDSIHPASATAAKPLNRRRLLRVGRPYVEGGKPAGTLFMCLNADIERQFELVQQTWLRNPEFAGLGNETDPLIGRAPEPRSFTAPTAHGPCRTALPDLVRMLGGGYFWLPGRKAVEHLSQPRPPCGRAAGRAAAAAARRIELAAPSLEHAARFASVAP